METLTGLLLGLIYIVWSIITFLIKLCIYVAYFFPMIGMKILKVIDLWPTIWPF